MNCNVVKCDDCKIEIDVKYRIKGFVYRKYRDFHNGGYEYVKEDSFLDICPECAHKRFRKEFEGQQMAIRF